MADPTSSPASTVTPISKIKTTLFTPPSRTKILELPEKLRTRAESTAESLALSFEQGPSRTALEHIARIRQESHIRVKPGDITHWGALSVRKRQQRQTDPAKAHSARTRALRPPPRLAVSAPVMPRGSSLTGMVAGSPVGNAWNGLHYWKPQFGESAPVSPATVASEDGAVQSDPVRRAVYDSVLADVEISARELKAEAQQNGERITDVEAAVVAAMTVLEEKNALYEAQAEFPLPQDVGARTKEFVEAQTRAVEENSIRDEAQLNESRRWLQIGRDGQLVTHVLDFAQANLKMIRERRKSAEMEMFAPAYGLVFAVQILEEKVRRLKGGDRVEDGSDDEVMEYGKFLKSLRELELGMEGEEGEEEEESPTTRRVGSECGAERRRLKGTAPSALDLRTWASELKGLDPLREGGDGGGENML